MRAFSESSDGQTAPVRCSSKPAPRCCPPPAPLQRGLGSGMRVWPSPCRPPLAEPRGADLRPSGPLPPPPPSTSPPSPPASLPPPFSHLLRPDPGTCWFRWLIVKGFDLQLTSGQDFLSTNPALFKHRNTLPSSLASVILIPPAADTPPGLGAPAAPQWAGGGRPGRRLPEGTRDLQLRRLPACGDAAEGRLGDRQLLPGTGQP